MVNASFHTLLPGVLGGNRKALARAISLVENECAGWEDFLQTLPPPHAPVVGITGPPGAGKSTLVDCLIGHWVATGKKVGILCVDPSSPFNFGALLGDRIRMNEWYNHPSVFIRSLATRGSLGGLHPHILEITNLMQVAGFDYVVVETVGVGQSEVEIAGLADCTVVVVVPEAGDEIQTMKAGLMEIADVFVVNKADRPEADQFARNLRLMLAPAYGRKAVDIPVIKTVAAHKEGIDELGEAIDNHLVHHTNNDRRFWLMADRAWTLLQQARMKPFDKKLLATRIKAASAHPDFNLYRFVQEILRNSAGG